MYNFVDQMSIEITCNNLDAFIAWTTTREEELKLKNSFTSEYTSHSMNTDTIKLTIAPIHVASDISDMRLLFNFLNALKDFQKWSILRV